MSARGGAGAAAKTSRATFVAVVTLGVLLLVAVLGIAAALAVFLYRVAALERAARRAVLPLVNAVKTPRGVLAPLLAALRPPSEAGDHET
jgi:hypothetical protein